MGKVSSPASAQPAQPTQPAQAAQGPAYSSALVVRTLIWV